MTVPNLLSLQRTLHDETSLLNLWGHLKAQPNFGYGAVYLMEIHGAFISEHGGLILDGITTNVLDAHPTRRKAYPLHATVLGNVNAPGMNTLHVVVQVWEPGLPRLELAVSSCDVNIDVYLYVFPTQKEAYAAFNQLTK